MGSLLVLKSANQSKSKVNDRTFSSEDTRFGLLIGASELRKIIDYSQQAYPLETGGILVGVYNGTHDCASVADVSRAPADSKAGPTWFYRGIKGLQAWLRQLWKHQSYYLGEWHFHPNGSPVPSHTDLQQIKAIAESRSYNCPEPILLIVGGCPDQVLDIGAYVWPRHGTLIALRESAKSAPSRR